jgi:hypothetical protein
LGNDKRSILTSIRSFSYNSFLDINFIEARVRYLSGTVDDQGLFLVGIYPQDMISSKEGVDQLTGTAFIY